MSDDRANVRFKGTQEYAWDVSKPFHAACERAGIMNLRIHDLRHMTTTILFLRTAAGIQAGRPWQDFCR